MKPLMVLAHGTRATQELWAPYPELVPSADLLAIDLPGHGEREGEPCHYDDVIRTFDDAVATAHPGQPVIVAGHSLGGYLAAMYAEHLVREERDGELSALVLIGTTADPASKLASLYKGFAKVLPMIGYERMATITGFFYRWLGVKGDDVPGADSYAALAEAWALVFSRCGPDNLRDVDCPVYLVNGQFDQMRIHARQFARGTASATSRVVKGASHILPATHPEQLAEILDEVARTVAAPRLHGHDVRATA